MNIGDQHRPLRNLVCDTIRERIIRGEYPPGHRLVEDQLAESLGVSRNPVRESLRVLETESFVVMVPRRGAMVASLTDKEVEEFFDVRVVLERLAAQLAARNATRDQIAQMEEAVATAADAVANEDPVQATFLNTRFHELVVEAADNGFLRDLMMQLRGRMQWIFGQTASSPRVPHSLDEHVSLLEAIAAANEDRACELAGAHVAAARASYRDRQQQAEAAAVSRTVDV